jgi:hypothetical protein
METDRDGDPIESALISWVRKLLDQPDDATERGLSLSAALGSLLERHLAADTQWSRYAWIDDAEPSSIVKVGPSSVAMTGLATIVDGKRWSLQPFEAVLRIDDNATSLEAYRLSLGDPSVELHAIPYGAKPPKHWPELSAWRFTFPHGDVP